MEEPPPERGAPMSDHPEASEWQSEIEGLNEELRRIEEMFDDLDELTGTTCRGAANFRLLLFGDPPPNVEDSPLHGPSIPIEPAEGDLLGQMEARLATIRKALAVANMRLGAALEEFRAQYRALGGESAVSEDPAIELDIEEGSE